MYSVYWLCVHNEMNSQNIVVTATSIEILQWKLLYYNFGKGICFDKLNSSVADSTIKKLCRSISNHLEVFLRTCWDKFAKLTGKLLRRDLALPKKLIKKVFFIYRRYMPTFVNVMRYVIWNYLYNLNYVENTPGGVLLLGVFQVS